MLLYTEQEEAARRSGHDFYLAYGPVGDEIMDLIGMDGEEVGRIVCESLARHGVKYEWARDPEVRILVKAHSIRPVGFRLRIQPETEGTHHDHRDRIRGLSWNGPRGRP